MSTVNSVLVIGAGQMGSQIAMSAALAGCATTLVDPAQPALESAEHMLHTRVDRMVEKGRITAEQAATAFARLAFATSPSEGAGSCDIVIEAIVERLDAKRELFADLDSQCPQHAIFTSNSSGFIPSTMADATSRADRFANMHFFNPALVMRCVEVVRGPETSDDTVAAIVDLAERMGKEPVVLNREIFGFVANRIVNAIRDEAVALYEADVASIEAIDAICRSALGHPMGPFELQDLTGLDIGYLTKQARYEESGDPRDRPSRSLTERYERGDLGRKTGRGWYTYTD